MSSVEYWRLESRYEQLVMIRRNTVDNVLASIVWRRVTLLPPTDDGVFLGIKYEYSAMPGSFFRQRCCVFLITDDPVFLRKYTD